MTREDMPSSDADADGDDDLAAARAAYRKLRDPVEPPPEVDARIRAAARKALTTAPGAPLASRGARPAGPGDASRSPSARDRARQLTAGVAGAGDKGGVGSPRRSRAYAGWGLALAAGLATWVVMLQPPAPFAGMPGAGEQQASEASPAAEAGTTADAGMDPAALGAAAQPPHALVLPSEQRREVDAGAGGPTVPATGASESNMGTPAKAHAEAVADSRVDAQRMPAATGVARPRVGADATPEGLETAAPAPPREGSVVRSSRTAAPPEQRASAPGTATPAAAGIGAPSAGPFPTAVADAAAPARPVELELEALRSMQRANDARLLPRLRAFVARYPGHPLARTDPALAALLAGAAADP